MSTRYRFMRVPAETFPLGGPISADDDTVVNDGSRLTVLRCRRLLEGTTQGVAVVLLGVTGDPQAIEKVNADHHPRGTLHLNVGDCLVRTRVHDDATSGETPMDLFSTEEALFREMEETLTAFTTRYESLVQKKAGVGIKKHTLTTMDLTAIRQLMAMQQRLLNSIDADV